MIRGRVARSAMPSPRGEWHAGPTAAVVADRQRGGKKAFPSLPSGLCARRGRTRERRRGNVTGYTPEARCGRKRALGERGRGRSEPPSRSSATLRGRRRAPVGRICRQTRHPGHCTFPARALPGLAAGRGAGAGIGRNRGPDAVSAAPRPARGRPPPNRPSEQYRGLKNVAAERCRELGPAATEAGAGGWGCRSTVRCHCGRPRSVRRRSRRLRTIATRGCPKACAAPCAWKRCPGTRRPTKVGQRRTRVIGPPLRCNDPGRLRSSGDAGLSAPWQLLRGAREPGRGDS